jgi:hypothetical protein
MAFVVAAMLAALSGAPDLAACPHWGPTLDGGLTVVKPCADPGAKDVAPLVLTRDTVASFVSGRWAGLVVDAATLQLAQGPVPEGGELLRIKARQGYVVRLTSNFVGRGLGGTSVKAGELLYGASMRQTITMYSPGQAPVENPLSGMVYLYCAPVRMASGPGEIDRGMCFIDSRENNKIGLFPGIRMNLDKQYTLALSGKGEAAHAPSSLEMAATMGVRKPKVEPADGPYPDPFDLVVTWTRRNGGRLLVARAVDAAGASTVVQLRGDAGPAMVFGGELALDPSPEGLTPRFVTPVVDGAIVGFHPDEAAR